MPIRIVWHESCDKECIMILVRDRMTAPPITVHLETPLSEVARLLEARAISAVPVVSHDYRCLGVVSTTDIVEAMSQPKTDAMADDDTWQSENPSKGAPSSLGVGEIMSTPVLGVGPDEPLEEAAWRLVAGRVHRLIVLQDGERPVGIISGRDMLRELVKRREMNPIRAIMSTPVESVDIGDTIDTAIVRLASAGVHGLVVVDGMAPVGVFTHTEALAARALPPAMRRSKSVEEVMSYETICLDVNTPIFRAAAYAVAMNVRRILVVESRHLVGILSCVDLVGVLSRAPESATVTASSSNGARVSGTSS
jgi:CBS domain-containing protein